MPPERRTEAGNREECDDMIYFAVGSDAERCWPNLSWVARNFTGHKICFIHVLQPTKMIPSENAPGDSEKQRIQEILKKHHRMLSDAGLERGGDIYFKKEKAEEGIVMLISRLKIKNLVMGAAAAREMVYFESKVTGYVSENATASCQIWFVHGGHLIRTRYDQMCTGGSSKKETYDESLRREQAEKESMKAACKETKNAITVDALTLDCSEIFGSTSSQSSVTKPSYNASYVPSTPPVVDISRGEEGENEMQVIAQPKETISHSSPRSALNEGTLFDELYEQLEHTMAELDDSKRETFEESSKRRKAEKRAVEASRRANSVMEERNMALREKSLLEDEIADFKKDNKQLTKKIALSVELMKRYKYELDECKAERDRALSAAEEMKHSAESSRSNGSLPHLLSEFSYSDIENATGHFDPSLKIDERGYWRIYKGVLHHTEVNIKLLNSDSSKGPSEYRQEVEALSRLRHPNIVTLIGACPEALAIIYEHNPNGSLEDRLNCENNSSPLPWQTRVCIAAELCCILVFLHSNKSHCIVHGDLKPANILLDANFNVKLSHFGLSRAMTTVEQLVPKSDVNRLTKILSRMVTQREANEVSSPSSSITSAASRRTKPWDTFVYMDLESVITKEYTPELDVYSFGIILLRLLTGRQACGIMKEVQLALDNGNLDILLDCLAGDWPYVQAQQLAKIAIRCSTVSSKGRPDLESQVLGVLQKMKVSCQGSLMGSYLGGELHSEAPPYCICPISQDIMQDPHVAADGFTYEKEGIQGWLNCGHHTSPMTNLKLEHLKLVPNRALKSAIQEWKQRH